MLGEGDLIFEPREQHAPQRLADDVLLTVHGVRRGVIQLQAQDLGEAFREHAEIARRAGASGYDRS